MEDVQLPVWTSDQPPAESVGQTVEHGDHHINGQRDGQQAVVIEHAHRHHQVVTDTARTDQTEDGGGAQVVIEDVHDGADEIGEHLRKDAEGAQLQPTCTVRSDAFDLACIDYFDALGEELAHEAD